MPDTSSPALSPEWLKLMAGLIHSGSFIAREEREKIAAALSRLAQVERERDASDAVVDWMTNEFPLKTADEEAELSALQGRAITRHRSRQQRGTT
jgi:hypothetical protein